MFSSKSKNTLLIKNKAKELGFDYCGISRADFLEEEAPRLENWLKNNYHGEMQWMENHFDKRLDPRMLVEGSKSVISFLLNYFPEEPINHQLKISKYAYGDDYHTVIKDKLKELMLHMKQEIGDFSGRAFVDSAPVMDKAWAEKGGLGWRGKNSNLINPKAGSFFFIAELITDLDLEYDGPMKDYCGTCTKCIDACPTNAISQAYVVDGSKCISYLTIELKNNIPSDFKGKMDNWIFGCDVCQDVCPWNRFSKAHKEPQFLPSEEFKNLKEWTELTSELFDEVFKKTAIKRTKFEGLQRNIKFLA